jgi:hypothetical protein
MCALAGRGGVRGHTSCCSKTFRGGCTQDVGAPDSGGVVGRSQSRSQYVIKGRVGRARSTATLVCVPRAPSRSFSYDLSHSEQ